MTMQRSEVLIVWFVTLWPLAAAAQSSEWDADAESASERSAAEEILERLRRSPIDLRTATEADLLQIPGVRRQEARSILRAVRTGAVTEIRTLGLIPGVRQETAECIAPFVTLSRPNTRPGFEGRLRSLTSFRSEGERMDKVRERLDLRIDGDRNANLLGPTRWEVRRTGTSEADLFMFAQTPGPFSGWTVTLGDLDVRSGSALLDAGRRTSILRPSDWYRRLHPDDRVLPGFDRATSGRGAAIQASDETRSLLFSITRSGGRDRSAMVGWTQAWPEVVTTHVAHHAEARASSIRVEHRSSVADLSAEGMFGPLHPSWVASMRWVGAEQTELHGVVRLLRGVPAAGVPRAGGRSSDETGVGVSLRHSLQRGVRWHLIGDVGRVDDRQALAGSSTPMSTVGSGCAVHGVGGMSTGVEWTRTTLGPDRIGRWVIVVGHRIRDGWEVSLNVTRRTEAHDRQPQRTGAMATATMTFESEEVSLQVRWITGGGDERVAFWTIGPGPTTLSGLQRVSGQAGQLRSVIQWQPGRHVGLSGLLSWAYRPVVDVRASILFEIQL